MVIHNTVQDNRNKRDWILAFEFILLLLINLFLLFTPNFFHICRKTLIYVTQ